MIDIKSNRNINIDFFYHILKQGHKYDVMIQFLPESPPGTEGYSDTIYNPVVRTPRMTDNSEP